PVTQRRVIAPQRNNLPVKQRKLAAAFDNPPEDRKLFEQRRSPRFSRVAYLHSVVKQRHAVKSEYKHRRRKRTALPEPGYRPAFVVVVGESHVKGASGKLRALLFPPASNRRCRCVSNQHLAQRRVERPRVVEVEGFDQKIWF